MEKISKEEKLKVLKKHCKCSECKLFGICPEHGWKLTRQEVNYLNTK